MGRQHAQLPPLAGCATRTPNTCSPCWLCHVVLLATGWGMQSHTLLLMSVSGCCWLHASYALCTRLGQVRKTCASFTCRTGARFVPLALCPGCAGTRLQGLTTVQWPPCSGLYVYAIWSLAGWLAAYQTHCQATRTQAQAHSTRPCALCHYMCSSPCPCTARAVTTSSLPPLTATLGACCANIPRNACWHRCMRHVPVWHLATDAVRALRPPLVMSWQARGPAEYCASCAPSQGAATPPCMACTRCTEGGTLHIAVF